MLKRPGESKLSLCMIVFFFFFYCCIFSCDGGTYWKSGEPGALHAPSKPPLALNPNPAMKSQGKDPKKVLKVRILSEKNGNSGGKKSSLPKCGQCEKASASLVRKKKQYSHHTYYCFSPPELCGMHRKLLSGLLHHNAPKRSSFEASRQANTSKCNDRNYYRPRITIFLLARLSKFLLKDLHQIMLCTLQHSHNHLLQRMIIPQNASSRLFLKEHMMRLPVLSPFKRL